MKSIGGIFMKKELPFFKYHPDPLKTEAFKTGKNVVCDCCGKETDVIILGLFIQLKILNIYVQNV